MFPSVRNAVEFLASEGMKGKQTFQKLFNKGGGFYSHWYSNWIDKIHDICRMSKDYNKSDLVEILDICKE